MSHQVRIGSQVGPGDPFWVQVREAVNEKAQQLGVDLLLIEFTAHPFALPEEEQEALLEEIISQDLDAVITQSLPDGLLHRLLAARIPIVALDETPLTHPLFVSPRGLYEAGRMVGQYLAAELNGVGRVMCFGGFVEIGRENGSTRLAGLQDAFRAYPALSWQHVPTSWDYDHAYEEILAALRSVAEPLDGIVGLSDSIALAARNAANLLGLLGPRTLVAGINGDPLVLAAIADGSMSATVETCAASFGADAVELAYQAARGQPLPSHFDFKLQLVTRQNVAEVALQKLIAVANLPTRLVGVRRNLEQNRLTQLEMSAAINRRVGALLNRRQLSQEIADLIRVNYGYDEVQLFLWSEADQMLTLEYPGAEAGRRLVIPLQNAGLLGEALNRKEAIFVPDTHHSPRFHPDPAWPQTRSRAILPIRLGDQTLGLLDLHSWRQAVHQRQELVGLQSLADQLGIAMRNAELYEEAVQARAVAEKADQLKTRLLANVSHELRAPLNVILGYSQSALTIPSPYGVSLPGELRRDLRHIYDSGEHLMRLINDLLDLSRAEIDALDLFPETIATRSFLEDVFLGMAGQSSQNGDGGGAGARVKWRLALPSHLPVLQADPVRLRQVLLNLLSNARKFTSQGEIVLGAEVEPPYLHIWVRDTGVGIPVDAQERIFEPFTTVERPSRRHDGVGLGLTITRRLVALHGGTITLDSREGEGSIFHVYLPLPGSAGETTPPATPSAHPVLLLVTNRRSPTQPIRDLCRRRGLALRCIRESDELASVLQEAQPVAIACDLADTQLRSWPIVQQLRRHPHLCQLPLVIYSDAAFDAGGVTSVLTKPVNSPVLSDTLRSLLPEATVGSVLIADDDPNARDFYQNVVGGILPDFPIYLAEDGQQALDYIASHVPSMVILDLTMPGADGFAVLERLRADPRTCQVPVLVLSGRLLTEEDVQRLDYARVVFQSKNVLATEEVAPLLQRTLSGEDRLPQPTSTLVKRALAYLHQSYGQAVSRHDVAQAVGVSENYLSLIFRQELGLSPLEYLTRFRIHQAKDLLRHSSATVTDIAGQVGFDDPAYFSRVFRKHVGQSPQAYREEAH
ncbi:MAG: substrate-binding domain-containing protein [Anaerolineae bacterium]